MQSLKNRLKLLVAAGLLWACGPTPMYEEYVSVPENSWDADSVVSFEVEIEDTTSVYQIVWYLRNNDDYEFSNIYLFRDVYSLKGPEFADTANFMLADAYGKWLGKGIGELKTNTWPFKNGYLQFKHSGTYVFNLQQAMRTSTLIGVEDVGLGIYKIDPE